MHFLGILKVKLEKKSLAKEIITFIQRNSTTKNTWDKIKRYFVISIFDNMRIKVENVVSYLLLKFFGYFSVFETKKNVEASATESRAPINWKVAKTTESRSK